MNNETLETCDETGLMWQSGEPTPLGSMPFPIMTCYQYKRSSRSWVNYSFFFSGMACLALAFLQFKYQWFGKSSEPGFSLFFFGILLFLGGAAGLIRKAEWEMQIDERRLFWKAGKHCDGLPVGQIKKVRVEEGDGRCMTIDMLDGAQHTIPGECYGNASDLREWFQRNLGTQIEVLS